MAYQFISFAAFGNRASFNLRVVETGFGGHHPQAGFEFETKGLRSGQIVREFWKQAEQALSILCVDLRARGSNAPAARIEAIFVAAECEEYTDGSVMSLITQLSSIHDLWLFD